MALLDDLADDKNFRGKAATPCTVCTLFNKLPKDDLKVLNSRLADTAITSAAIARVLTANGHNVQGQTLARHRRGDCQNVTK